MEIIIDIKNCKECPFFEQERMYTADSFEEPYNWFCKKGGGKKKIQGYVEWHEESKVPIPDWCPCLPEHVSAEKIKQIAETYHDRLVMTGMSGGDNKCECCGKKTVTRTCIEHDSQDFSKDLWVCADCYAAIATYWKEHRPKKIAPI
jgi:hypothetical protein